MSAASARFDDPLERVTLQCNNKEIVLANSYEITISYLTQPAHFSLRLGSSAAVRELLKQFPPWSKFQLFIGGKLQQTGRVLEPSVTESGGSSVQFYGEDALCTLQNGYIDAEKTYQEKTYTDFVRKILDEAGFRGVPLHANNAANRRMRSGIQVPLAQEPLLNSGRPLSPRAKLGERRLHFLNRHLERAGLFLFAAADGSFVLSAPTVHQPPLYRILRRRGAPANDVSVRLSEYRNGIRTPRCSVCVVYARGGGRGGGRVKVSAQYEDAEMVSLGVDQPLTFHDSHCKTIKECEFFARRKVAEGRRAAWRLAYIVPGHATRTIGGGKAVWTTDTMVEVADDELGIYDLFWLESVTHKMDGKSEALVHLMRPDDLVFGSDDAAA
jgi:prophage tail gpP-like protein